MAVLCLITSRRLLQLSCYITGVLRNYNKQMYICTTQLQQTAVVCRSHMLHSYRYNKQNFGNVAGSSSTHLQRFTRFSTAAATCSAAPAGPPSAQLGPRSNSVTGSGVVRECSGRAARAVREGQQAPRLRERQGHRRVAARGGPCGSGSRLRAIVGCHSSWWMWR